MHPEAPAADVASDNMQVRPDKDYLELQSFTGTTGGYDGVATVRCNINGRRDGTASVTRYRRAIYQGIEQFLRQADTTQAFGGRPLLGSQGMLVDGAPTTFAPGRGTERARLGVERDD